MLGGGVPSSSKAMQELEDDLLKPSDGGLKELPPADWACHWERRTDPRDLLAIAPSAPTTTLRFQARGLDGVISSYSEASTYTRAASSRRSAQATETAASSGSMARKPAAKSDFIRGKSDFVPFRPGGLDGVVVGEGDNDDAAEGLVKAFEKGGIKTIPPGFTRGLDFGPSLDDGEDMAEQTSMRVEPIYRDTAPAREPPRPTRRQVPLDPAIDELLPSKRLDASTVTQKPVAARKRAVVAKRDWAHVVDVNREIANFHQLVPDMARTWPFELDTFQKEAIYHMEVGESVFVAAHTSAGKTVVAEYAIALAQRHMTRAIYTSPIKALSNQKFRDFQRTFDPSQVGILTGDVQINPEASCLIMTTEILRSMLYKGADLIRDVEWVIFDEVHYVNDMERGVVWEEVIIMLPEHVNIILLSATVPNTKEFADWVGRTKKKDIYVISTAKRPVPLEHHLYAGRELFKIVDSKSQFLTQGWKAASDAMKRKQDKEREALIARGGAPAAAAAARGRGRGRGGGAVVAPGPRPAKGSRAHDATLWIHLVGHLRKKELLPVVVFTFSKRRCEENAASMPNTDLCSAAEKSEVHIVIERSITRLKGSDKTLPQIMHMRQLLSRGIGVHHGGLLPIVKEIVEILFARGLVKVLFATETFAMGVNMPAKSVVFSGIRKHDGRSFRDLLPGEYTQMSGRAGRRGLDATGTVIIVADNDLPDTATLSNMLLGQPTKLKSQFRLTYSMILNLLRVEALRVEEMIKRSFSENASQRLLPDHQRKVAEGEQELKALQRLDDSPKAHEVRRYYDWAARLVELNQRIITGALSHPSRIISTHRVVLLSDGHFRHNAAVVLKPAEFATGPDGVIDDTRRYYVLAFVPPDIRHSKLDVDAESVPPRWPPVLAPEPHSELTYELAIVPYTSIELVTNVTMRGVDADKIVDRISKSAMQAALASFADVIGRLRGVDIEADWAKLRALEFREALDERSRLSRQSFTITDDPDFPDMYRALHTEQLLRSKIDILRLALSDENLELLPDYEQRVAVLKEMNFIDERSTVLLKGRVACEINSANELILTELILNNAFAPFEPEEVVALLSAFVFQEKSETEPLLTPKLEEGKDAIMDVAETVRSVQAKHRADVADEGFAISLKFNLVEVVYEWAKGMPFSQITQLTDVQEGTIVRAITRLDETCREVRDAARIVGNADLFKKMEECQSKIRRDIVFCASLYF